MLYKDYLNSARKHIHTCKVLSKHIETLDEKNNGVIVKCLILNLYYLSGYIIECVVKYGIYDLIGYPRKKKISELNQEKLNYSTHIKHHKFEKYTEHLTRRMHIQIPLINTDADIDREIKRLYKNWDATVRYSYDLNGISKSNYLKFFEYSEKIFNIIILNVRG